VLRILYHLSEKKLFPLTEKRYDIIASSFKVKPIEISAVGDFDLEPPLDYEPELLESLPVEEWYFEETIGKKQTDSSEEIKIEMPNDLYTPDIIPELVSDDEGAFDFDDEYDEFYEPSNNFINTYKCKICNKGPIYKKIDKYNLHMAKSKRQHAEILRKLYPGGIENEKGQYINGNKITYRPIYIDEIIQTKKQKRVTKITNEVLAKKVAQKMKSYKIKKPKIQVTINQMSENKITEYDGNLKSTLVLCSDSINGTTKTKTKTWYLEDTHPLPYWYLKKKYKSLGVNSIIPALGNKTIKQFGYTKSKLRPKFIKCDQKTRPPYLPSNLNEFYINCLCDNKIDEFIDKYITVLNQRRK